MLILPAGYQELDPLEVYGKTAPLNCSSATVKVRDMGKKPSCYANDTYTVRSRQRRHRGAGGGEEKRVRGGGHNRIERRGHQGQRHWQEAELQ